MVRKFTRDDLKVGCFCEFNHLGFRLGRIIKRKGRMLTVVLSPFKVRGKHKGKRKRIHVDAVKGILYRKKVVMFDEQER